VSTPISSSSHINIIFSSSDIYSFVGSLGKYSTKEIYDFIVNYNHTQPLPSSIYNAAASFLSRDLSTLTLKELIKLTEVYIEADSTHSIMSDLFNEFNRNTTLGPEEIISLLLICQKTASLKEKQPPNQILVNFLEQLKNKVISLIEADITLFNELKSKLNTSIYTNMTVAVVLDALLLTNNPISQKSLKKVSQKAIDLLLSHYSNDYTSTPTTYINLHLVQASVLSTLYGRNYNNVNIYNSKSSYRTNAAKIQWMVSNLSLGNITALATANAKSSLRDISFLKTLSRQLSNLVNSQPLNPTNLPSLITTLESYAKLNINNPQLFDLCYRQVVPSSACLNMSDEDAIRLLYGTSIFGLTGSHRSKVKHILSAVSSRFNNGSTTTLNPDSLLRLELIKLFARAYLPNPALPLTGSGRTATSNPGNCSLEEQIVSNFLNKKNIVHIQEGFIPEYPHPVDFIIERSSNPHIKSDTIIEVDGPYHFDRSGITYRGLDILKNYLLQSRWNVIRVDVRDIDESRLEEILANMTTTS